MERVLFNESLIIMQYLGIIAAIWLLLLPLGFQYLKIIGRKAQVDNAERMLMVMVNARPSKGGKVGYDAFAEAMGPARWALPELESLPAFPLMSEGAGEQEAHRLHMLMKALHYQHDEDQWWLSNVFFKDVLPAARALLDRIQFLLVHLDDDGELTEAVLEGAEQAGKLYQLAQMLVQELQVPLPNASLEAHLQQPFQHYQAQFGTIPLVVAHQEENMPKLMPGFVQSLKVVIGTLGAFAIDQGLKVPLEVFLEPQSGKPEEIWVEVYLRHMHLGKALHPQAQVSEEMHADLLQYHALLYILGWVPEVVEGPSQTIVRFWAKRQV